MKLRLSLFSALVVMALSMQATVHNVSVGNFFFTPNTLTISVGDTVLWTNTTGTHNVNGSTATFPSNPDSFINGPAASGSWTYQFQFTVQGTYSFQCDPHAGGMNGTITVNAGTPTTDLLISGVYDGPLPGGNPKGVELYVVNNINDLSLYGLGSANNGGGTDGQEFTFPAVSASAGDYIYVTTDTAEFRNFFGFGADYQDGSMGINGDDAIELFSNGSVADVFGDINVDGTNQPWEYLDTWAYRVSATGPDGSTFVLGNWTYSPLNTFDNLTTNASASPAMPIGTYSLIAPPTITNIADITTDDATGVADSLNVTVTVVGTVYTDDFDGNNGYSFYVYDATGGINVYNFADVNGYQVNRGDILEIYGDVDQFNGLTELVPDSIHIVGTGATLVSPTLVSDLDATTEGEYIQMNNMMLADPTQWPAGTGSFNVDITNGTDTVIMRVDSDTDIDGTPAPTGMFNVVGAGGQFDSSSPFDEGYQIFPRDLLDITLITSGISTINIADITTDDATGVADSLGLDTVISGIVYTDDFDGNNGYSFFVYDATGGINVYNFADVSGYQVNRGDNLLLYGTVDQFNGLTEFVPDSIFVMGTGVGLNAPTVVSDLDATTEGEYIRMDNMFLADPTQWPAGTGSFNVDITNGTDTVIMRVDSDTDIDGTPAPTGTFSVIGAGGQFDSSSPFDEGYQILPRDLTDIIPASVIGAGGIPNYQIAQLTGVDANGVVDSNGVEARIHGVVFTDDFDGNAGYSFNVYDATGGVNIFSFNDVGTYAVTRGDSLRIIGTLGQFNGLTQFVPDSIVVLAQGVTLKTPVVSNTANESTEGDYIRLNNYTVITPSQWPVVAGGSANVDITNGTDTVIMRIDSDTDINGTPVPTGLFDVIGSSGQFDGSSPFDEGYQILPRDTNDIIPVIAATPTVNFPVGAQSQLEDAGTITVTLPIAPVSANAETVKIYVSNGTGITAGDYTTAPAPVNDTISLTVPANAGSVSFDVIITDDTNQESNEDITLTLASASAGLSIGSINTHVFTIQDNDTPIPTYNIDQLVDVDSDGIADSIGVYVRVVGTVTSPQLSATRTDFFITNSANTAGIKVNRASLIAYNAIMGDEIAVVGTLSQFRGGIQIDPDSVRVVTAGGPQIQPIVFNQNLGESTEGRVLRLNGVELVDTTGWPSANFGNFDIVLATGDTVILRIDSDIPTIWGPAPAGTFDVIGVAGQYSSSSSAPFNDGYQILPRDANEIIVKLPKLVISEVMPSSNLSGAIGGDWFEVTNFGQDPISLNGYSWDDESRTAGTHTIATVASFIIDAGQSIIFYDGVTPEDSAWAYEWSQLANGIVVVAADDFGGIGFSGLSSGGDEVNLYDQNGQLISRATFAAGDVTAGISIEYDTTSTLVGLSVVGVNGAYASAGGDIGSPGNMMPISIAEFLLNDMDIYPNPATALVKLSSGTNATKQVEILDLSGRPIERISSTQETVELNVSSLPKGVYIIKVTMDGVSASQKLIVQ
jgi:plastocyanin